MGEGGEGRGGEGEAGWIYVWLKAQVAAKALAATCCYLCR